MIGIVIAVGAAVFFLGGRKRPALEAAAGNKSFGANQAVLGKMFAPVDQQARPTDPYEALRQAGVIVPSGGGWVSDTISTGASAALGAAKTYADAKTGGAVSKAETQIGSGDYAGAAASYNAGITVSQPTKR